MGVEITLLSGWATTHNKKNIHNIPTLFIMMIRKKVDLCYTNTSPPKIFIFIYNLSVIFGNYNISIIKNDNEHLGDESGRKSLAHL